MFLFRVQFKTVPDLPLAPDRKAGIGQGRIQLFPQVPYVALYGVALIAKRILVPHFLVYLVISEDVSLVHHQKVEKVILLHRKADLLTAAVYLPAVEVNLKPRY